LVGVVKKLLPFTYFPADIAFHLAFLEFLAFVGV